MTSGQGVVAMGFLRLAAIKAIACFQFFPLGTDQRAAREEGELAGGDEGIYL